MKRIAALSLCLALIGMAKGSAALNFCVEPREPSCISFKMGDWDDSDFRLCKMEVEGYLRDLSTWQDCVADDANARARKAVDKFNCYARGQSVCF